MSHTEIVNYSFVHAVLPAGSRTTETENRRTPAEGAGRGSLASRMRAVERRKERERRNEEGRGEEGEGAHREIKTREREGDGARDGERDGAFLFHRSSALATTAAEEERGRWQAMERIGYIREGGEKRG